MKLYIVFPTFSFSNEIVYRKRDGYVSKFISLSLVTMMDQRLICISEKSRYKILNVGFSLFIHARKCFINQDSQQIE